VNKLRLLVVDDEEINRDIIAEYLDSDEYELTMVEDGELALQRLREDAPFDAVVLDRMMPGIDGLAVLRRMQADERLRSVPVIMQTAAASREQIAEGLKEGAYYYLTKPYHRDALVAVVRAALDGLQRRSALNAEVEQYRGVMGLTQSARFRVQTLQQARALTVAISSLASEPANVAIGLLELLINAIEHGNLGITFHEKASLLMSERWEEEVEQRLTLPINADKFAEVAIEREPKLLRISIRDRGPGFDWRSYLVLNESRALYPNGRGIAVARHVAFKTMDFIEPGNQVIATFTSNA
jgi:CheY-like chemotaxis protein